MPQATHAEEGENSTPVPVPPQNMVSSFTLRDVLITAFFHLRTVLVAAVLPLAIAITAAFSMRTEYTATSLLLVIVSREVSNAQNVTDSGPPVMTIEGLKQVQSEVQMLESTDVMRATIEQIGIDRLYPRGRLAALMDIFGSDPNRMDGAVARFRKSLKAEVVEDSNVVEVSFTNPDRSLAIETTDALVRNYLASRRKALENPTAKILQLEVARFQRDLSTVDNEIERLKNKVGIIDFSQDAVLASNQVDSILQRRRQVAEREAAVSGQILEAERQLAATPESVFDFSEKTDAVAGDDDANTLTRLLVQRDRVVAQYAPGSALLRELDKQIATVRARIKSRADRRYFTDRAVRNPQLNYLQNMVVSLKVEQDSLARQKNELVEQQRIAEERLSLLRSAETPLIELNRKRDALSDGFREYQRRAVAASIEETAAQSRQSAVRVVQEAGAAVTSRSLTLPVLAGGVFAGLLFGAAAGAIASALRTTFIAPGEAERALGLPAIATMDDDDEDADLAMDSAVGSFVTTLLDARIDDEPIKAVHFLSADTDDTLSRFTLRVAEEFAIRRQKRTLFIELGANAPAPLALDGQEIKGGMAITGTPLPLLWTASETQNAPLMDIRLPVADAEMMMAELRDAFDFILICSNRQGASLVTQRFCQLVDGNIMSLEAEKTRKAVAIHLRDMVVESRGLLLGFVLLGRRYYLPSWLYERI
ncbi:GumC family protein [Xanthobacter sp. AM11]|uniref:GumC family protein n=1 Tax=Xanthobacter sp. AM11 TaxID=3380643 RepID=UPI0039BFA0D6